MDGLDLRHGVVDESLRAGCGMVIIAFIVGMILGTAIQSLLQ